MDHLVFISYSTKDTPLALLMCRRFEEAGIRYWFAPRVITKGPRRLWKSLCSSISGSTEKKTARRSGHRRPLVIWPCWKERRMRRDASMKNWKS